MRLGGWLLGGLMVVLAASGGWAKDAIRDSVVKLHVTQRPPDFLRPWTKANPATGSGSGVVIEGKRILTNAHVVTHASQLFVQASETTDRVPAKVLIVAPDIDLALVTVDDESFFDNRPAVPLAEAIPDMKATVNVYGYPIGGDQLSITEGIISRIECIRSALSPPVLRIQIDAALNPGNSGGPAIVDGKIAGLVFSKVQQAENVGYLISAEEIATFLADCADGDYNGKPMIRGIALQTTDNEALRARLQLPKDAGGLMISKIDTTGGEESPFKAWDVITHVGEEPIDQQGTVKIREDLRLSFFYLVPKLAKDGAVPMKVWRDGKPIDVMAPTPTKAPRLVPALGDGYPRYFIHGPMVFTTVTQELAVQIVGPMEMYLRALRSPLLSRQFDRPAFEGEELVIIAYRLIPHRITKGYDAMTLALVDTINGTKVKNLAHLVELIRDADGEFLTVTFAGDFATLVFRRQELIDATEEILADEGIRNQYSPDLEEAWKGKKE
ncbi:MAG: trypsin-like peptidase domain-containing protein [Pirellulales bacterium]|nr:trypsin-like peptidase domain-containing protein [Pirellulales bacterium]